MRGALTPHCTDPRGRGPAIRSTSNIADLAKRFTHQAISVTARGLHQQQGRVHRAPTLLKARGRGHGDQWHHRLTNDKQQDSHLRLKHHAQETAAASSREEKSLSYSQHRVKQSGDIYTLRVPPFSTPHGDPSS
ncbi:Hypothetical predicted protein [Pelobates cultripes]|uniref:Uncharacterized protein n=1 Tax=Pelobates cultripes TaxID=61616 RepID=A0AAD1RA33_PELCU|nr:Hypothetical predicted protein [Pelobates cultripes]